MTELYTTAAYEAVLAVRSEEERLIDVRVVPWGVVAETPQGRERFRRGAFRGTRPGDVALEAIGPHGNEPGVRLAGRAIALEDRDDGQHATFRVSRTRDGDELLELARDGVYRNASAVFEPVTQIMGRDGVTERQSARLHRVGIVERGAYQGAEVLAVRNAQEGSSMVAETEPMPAPEPPPEPEPEPTPPGAGVTVLARSADNGAALEALRQEMLGRMLALEARPGAIGQPSPLARFASLEAFATAAYADPDVAPLLARALANQITSEQPGVIPPAWVQEIQGILASPRPAVTATGGARGLGDSGMELDWPYLDPALNLDTIVAKQTAEKTEITSVKVKILKGSAAIDTYAGGSDVSYQLIRRSSPSYREAYLRILAIAYARTTEAVYEAALLAGAGDSVVIAAAATADAVRAAYFAASLKVQSATGSPATWALASPTEFARLGGLTGLQPPQYGTSNITGTASASTLRINISGLEVTLAPFLAGQVTLFGNEEGAAWHEDGPFPISAEDVAKLGQNVAIWGMGTTALYVPKGIIKSTLT